MDENLDKKRKRKKHILLITSMAVLLIIGCTIFAYIKYDNCTEPQLPTAIINGKTVTLSIDKPIIYLYPEEDMNISVELGRKENITCSYPQYTNGWNIFAKQNGDLIDLDTGRSLYALYYESTNAVDFRQEKDGFAVRGTEVANFLEEKLAILGLTEKEAEEFIVYWLPKLQANKYNYIRFATMEEINENMPLKFSVEPNSLIRVLMIYKSLDEYIDVEEQKLTTPERVGFVAVEWGGTEIK